MANFTVTVADADIERVTAALCSIDQSPVTVGNATRAVENLILRITKDHEDKIRRAYVLPIPQPPQITVVAV
jgi:hypothetical protein